MGSESTDQVPANLITLRQLDDDTCGIVKRVHLEKQTLLITHRGRFVAKLVPLDDREIIIEGLTLIIEEDPEAFGVTRPTISVDEAKQRLGFRGNDQS